MPIRHLPGNREAEYLLICHDAEGRERSESPDGRDILSERAAAMVKDVTDVFLISHGWKGDVPAAIVQYDKWIAAMAECEAHPESQALRADVSEAGEVDRIFDALEQSFGGLDVLINNAGIAGPTARVEDVAMADWQRTVAVDLNGVFYCTRRAIPLLRRSANASIINIASNAALFGLPLRSPHTACKWALIGLTKTWAMELGPEGIRVNAVCPGSVEGSRIRQVIRRDALARHLSEVKLRPSTNARVNRPGIPGGSIS